MPTHCGVRTARYKLIRFYLTDEWEYYDMEKDPDELANQYANPEYASAIADLTVRLVELRKQNKLSDDIGVQQRRLLSEY